MNKRIQKTETPEWMTKGKTTPIQKAPHKETAPNNYRPITYLAEAKIQRGIFQRDALWPLLFVIAKMQLDHILRKCTVRYKLSKSQEKFHHLMYMDDIKLFAKCEKVLENLMQAARIYRQDIWMEFDIEKCAK